LIFVGVVPVGGRDGIAGVLFCRWLPPLVVSGWMINRWGRAALSAG
jgi:hypothetical protein